MKQANKTSHNVDYNGIELDEAGFEKAWRQFRKQVGKKEFNSNEDYKKAAHYVISSYIIHKGIEI